MLVGLVGMLLGVILPFLMLLEMLPSTFLLNFLAFTLSVSGLMMGIIGIALYTDKRRHHRDD